MMNAKKERKYNIITSACIFIFGNIYLLTSYTGIGLPEEKNLSYTQGLLDVYERTYEINKTANYVALDRVEDTASLLKKGFKSGEAVFSCTYSSRYNSCYDKKQLKRDIEPHLGKLANVGWYKQKSIWGTSINQPQLVSIEVDGKNILSYQDTRKNIKSSNRVALKFIGIITLSAILSYWFFEWGGKRRREKQIK